MRMTQMDTILIRMLYLTAAGIVMLTVLGAETVSSALFGLTFVLVVLLWLSGSMRNVIWTDAVMILLIGLTLGNVIINAWVEGTPVNVNYFKKYIMFICTLIYFQAAFKLHIDDATEKFLLNINSLLAVIFVAAYAVNDPAIYMIRGRVSNYLTFGFTNPNLVALFLMCIYTGEMIRFFKNKSVFGRLFHLLLAAAVCFFIWETESRNCLITIALETVFCILLHLTRKGFRFPKWLAFVVAVWPLLFVMVYMAFVYNARIQELFAFLVSEGKSLGARISVWQPALKYYWESPIWGAYSQISRGTGMSQMHNSHLDILVSYGTVVLILVCGLLYSMLYSRNRQNLKAETMARICFAATIIMGMGEAALFSGGLGIYLFAGMFLLMCNKEQKEPAERLAG